ncbi:MAG: hypothetical protein ABL966_00480 [Acidimicrobiales bacterium]
MALAVLMVGTVGWALTRDSGDGDDRAGEVTAPEGDSADADDETASTPPAPTTSAPSVTAATVPDPEVQWDEESLRDAAHQFSSSTDEADFYESADAYPVSCYGATEVPEGQVFAMMASQRISETELLGTIQVSLFPSAAEATTLLASLKAAASSCPSTYSDDFYSRTDFVVVEDSPLTVSYVGDLEMEGQEPHEVFERFYRSGNAVVMVIGSATEIEQAFGSAVGALELSEA